MSLLDSYFRIPEAAAFLGVHPETIKRLCQRGRIPAEKVHNTWLIDKGKLEEFAAAYNTARDERYVSAYQQIPKNINQICILRVYQP